MLEWAIYDASCADVPITRVVVTSDDEDVLNLARRHHCLAHQRPAELATDEAPTVLALKDVLDNVLAPWEPDAILCLQATNPLRLADDITRAVSYLKTGACDSVHCVVDHGIYLERLEYPDKPQPYCASRSAYVTRQRSKKMLLRDGTLYLTRADLIAAGRLYGDRPARLLIPRYRALDIEGPEELEEARRRCSQIGDYPSRILP